MRILNLIFNECLLLNIFYFECILIKKYSFFFYSLIKKILLMLYGWMYIYSRYFISNYKLIYYSMNT